jgi:hypothetical protein
MEVVSVLLILPLVAVAALSVWGVFDSLRAEEPKTAVWGWAVLFVLDMFLAFLFWGVR